MVSCGGTLVKIILGIFNFIGLVSLLLKTDNKSKRMA